jgi:hypothetical protein
VEAEEAGAEESDEAEEEAEVVEEAMEEVVVVEREASVDSAILRAERGD